MAKAGLKEEESSLVKKIKKTIELIEHLKFSDAFFSYGVEDENA